MFRDVNNVINKLGRNKMECPYCNSERIEVNKTINHKNSVERYRYCETCGKYFHTIEMCKDMWNDFVMSVLE